MIFLPLLLLAARPVLGAGCGSYSCNNFAPVAVVNPSNNAGCSIGPTAQEYVELAVAVCLCSPGTATARLAYSGTPYDALNYAVVPSSTLTTVTFSFNAQYTRLTNGPVYWTPIFVNGGATQALSSYSFTLNPVSNIVYATDTTTITNTAYSTATSTYTNTESDIILVPGPTSTLACTGSLLVKTAPPVTTTISTTTTLPSKIITKTSIISLTTTMSCLPTVAPSSSSSSSRLSSASSSSSSSISSRSSTISSSAISSSKISSSTSSSPSYTSSSSLYSISSGSSTSRSSSISFSSLSTSSASSTSSNIPVPSVVGYTTYPSCYYQTPDYPTISQGSASSAAECAQTCNSFTGCTVFDYEPFSDQPGGQCNVHSAPYGFNSAYLFCNYPYGSVYVKNSVSSNLSLASTTSSSSIVSSTSSSIISSGSTSTSIFSTISSSSIVSSTSSSTISSVSTIPSSVQVDGFTLSQGCTYDSNINSLGYNFLPDPQSCKTTCSAWSCTFFVYIPTTGKCSIYSGDYDPTHLVCNDPTSNFYAAIPPTPPPATLDGFNVNQGCTYNSNIGSLGYNILPNPQDCRTTCLAWSCTFLVYTPSTGKCSIYSGAYDPAQLVCNTPASNFYTAIPAPPPPPVVPPPATLAGFNVNQGCTYDSNIGSYGYNILPDPQDCRTTCLAWSCTFLVYTPSTGKCSIYGGNYDSAHVVCNSAASNFYFVGASSDSASSATFVSIQPSTSSTSSSSLNVASVSSLSAALVSIPSLTSSSFNNPSGSSPTAGVVSIPSLTSSSLNNPYAVTPGPSSSSPGAVAAITTSSSSQSSGSHCSYNVQIYKTCDLSAAGQLSIIVTNNLSDCQNYCLATNNCKFSTFQTNGGSSGSCNIYSNPFDSSKCTTWTGTANPLQIMVVPSGCAYPTPVVAFKKMRRSPRDFSAKLLSPRQAPLYAFPQCNAVYTTVTVSTAVVFATTTVSTTTTTETWTTRSATSTQALTTVCKKALTTSTVTPTSTKTLTSKVPLGTITDTVYVTVTKTVVPKNLKTCSAYSGPLSSAA